ncbi:hypothetical protein [Bartonella phoceensis]|uniref:hypothetical protein n=1 Tax=Bartonella phoceensis TaxID=270249 RepID=UPI001ABA9769|nr:hypothetical protein [Bartonella phoceensis]
MVIAGTHLRYAALQGENFATLEGQNTTTHFGIAGTYGMFSIVISLYPMES